MHRTGPLPAHKDDERKGCFNHDKPRQQMVDEMMRELDDLYAATEGLPDNGRTSNLYQLISRYMMGAFRPIPNQVDVWARQDDAGIDTIDHCIVRKDWCNFFKEWLGVHEHVEVKKRLYTAALDQYLEAIEGSIERLTLSGAQDLRVDRPNVTPGSEPKGQRGRRSGKEPGGPLESKATLQIIDRMISIICAREHYKR